MLHLLRLFPHFFLKALIGKKQTALTAVPQYCFHQNYPRRVSDSWIKVYFKIKCLVKYFSKPHHSHCPQHSHWRHCSDRQHWPENNPSLLFLTRFFDDFNSITRNKIDWIKNSVYAFVTWDQDLFRKTNLRGTSQASYFILCEPLHHTAAGNSRKIEKKNS